MNTDSVGRTSLTRFAWLSVGAAVLTIGLKSAAYLLTGSVGLLSDAIESIVNLVGALMALAMLVIAARPADEDHAHGHDKAEYFSSGVEGTLIFLAALSIAYTSVRRLLQPAPLEQVGLGLGVSVLASLLNLGVARVLLNAARRHRSVTLEADARHLLTDVWTSAGVLLGVGLVALTGWERLDPLVALAVAGNIVWTGFKIVRSSVAGLMDASLPEEELALIRQALAPHLREEVQSHALRTRQAGARRFISLHVLVPGSWTVQRGHQLLERIEADLRRSIPGAVLTTHLESLGDKTAWADMSLDRSDLLGPEGDQPREPDPAETGGTGPALK